MSISLNPDSDQVQQSREAAQSFVQQYLADLGDEPFSAREILDQHPALRDYQSCVIDLAYEEFCRLREHGADVQPTEFVRNFEGVEQSLYRVIEFDQVLHDHPSLIENVPEERWPDAGSLFCGFELTELIGRGALSRVFTARQTGLGGRRVIVKVCIRGEREAEFLGKLEHSHIAAVHSVHTDPETGLVAICMPYVTRATMHHVSEWLSGKDRRECTADSIHAQIVRYNHGRKLADDEVVSLEEHHSSDPLAFYRDDSFSTTVLKWGVQLAEALHFAHARNVLHCDVKPANVLLREDLNASLLDFNLASDSNDALRLAGGTLPYMASEQLLHLMVPADNAISSAPVDTDAATPKTDVFGLCATLWHLAAGEPPFGVCADSKSRGDAAAIILQRQKNGPSAAQVAEFSDQFGPDLCQVLLMGLACDPADRHADARQLSLALQALLPSPPKPPINWKLILGTSSLIAAAIVGPVLFHITAEEPEQPLVIRVNVQLTAKLRRTLINGAIFDIMASRFETAQGTLEAHTKFADARFLKLFAQTNALEAIQKEDTPDAAFSRNSKIGKADAGSRIFTIPARGEETLVTKADTATSQSKNIPTAVADNPVNPWEDVLSDWLEMRMADEGKYAKESAVNAALIRLEFATPGNRELAKSLFDAAAAPDWEPACRRRMIPILEISLRQHMGSAEATLHELATEILEQGTRGEILTFIDATRVTLNAFSRTVPRAKQSATDLPEPLCEVLKKVLDYVEDSSRARVQPDSLRALSVPPLRNCAELRKQLANVKSMKSTSVATHNLLQVMVLYDGSTIPERRVMAPLSTANSAD